MEATGAENEDVNTSAKENINGTNTPPSSSSAVTRPGHQLPSFAATPRHCDLERPFFQLHETKRQIYNWSGETTRYLECEIISGQEQMEPVSWVHEIRLEHAERRAEAFERVVEVLTGGRWRQEFEGLRRGAEDITLDAAERDETMGLALEKC